MFFKKKTKIVEYDKENLVPVILSSICTGEMTAGFQNIHTKEFIGECLVKNKTQIDEFKKKYGITEEIKKIY